MMDAPAVAGLDGCRGGWVMVVTAIDGDRAVDVTVERVTDLASVFRAVDRGDLIAVGIDIPIGLPEIGPRRCDAEARAMTGPRRSSVFPAPGRALLGAATYDDATERSRALSGKGLSRQAFGILSKVREVDVLMTPERQRRIVEVHPEVCFTVLSGRPMAHYKKTPAGRAERLAALCRFFGDVDVHVDARGTGAKSDDVVDAFAAAWSAWRWSAGSHIQLGGECDERNLRMEIVA